MRPTRRPEAMTTSPLSGSNSPAEQFGYPLPEAGCHAVFVILDDVERSLSNLSVYKLHQQCSLAYCHAAHRFFEYLEEFLLHLIDSLCILCKVVQSADLDF